MHHIIVDEDLLLKMLSRSYTKNLKRACAAMGTSDFNFHKVSKSTESSVIKKVINKMTKQTVK